MKESLQKPNKVLKNRKASLETKEKVLKCIVIYILLYGNECWIISANMKKRLGREKNVSTEGCRGQRGPNI